MLDTNRKEIPYIAELQLSRYSATVAIDLKKFTLCTVTGLSE